jgi:large subunit ribosomal protein L3
MKRCNSEATEKDKEKAKVYSQERVWTPTSRRTGLIALKKGMSVVWDEQGIRVPVTVLQIQDNQVLANILTSRGPSKESYHAVQIGAKNISPEKVHIGMRGHFRKAGVPCKQHVKEFVVSEDAHLPPGEFLFAIRICIGAHIS